MAEITFFSDGGGTVARFSQYLPAIQMRLTVNTEYKCDAIISPANSLGEIQGGIDMVYYRTFGRNALQQYIYSRVKKEHHGEILVGQYMTIDLREIPNVEYKPSWPKYLILCPTMTFPRKVKCTRNAYYFCRAMFDAIDELSDKVQSVWCPIPAVGVGKMMPEDVGKQCRNVILARVKKGPIFEIYESRNNPLQEMNVICSQYGMRK